MSQNLEAADNSNNFFYDRKSFLLIQVKKWLLVNLFCPCSLNFRRLVKVHVIKEDLCNILSWEVSVRRNVKQDYLDKIVFEVASEISHTLETNLRLPLEKLKHISWNLKVIKNSNATLQCFWLHRVALDP